MPVQKVRYESGRLAAAPNIFPTSEAETLCSRADARRTCSQGAGGKQRVTARNVVQKVRGERQRLQLPAPRHRALRCGLRNTLCQLPTPIYTCVLWFGRRQHRVTRSACHQALLRGLHEPLRQLSYVSVIVSAYNLSGGRQHLPAPQHRALRRLISRSALPAPAGRGSPACVWEMPVTEEAGERVIWHISHARQCTRAHRLRQTHQPGPRPHPLIRLVLKKACTILTFRCFGSHTRMKERAHAERGHRAARGPMLADDLLPDDGAPVASARAASGAGLHLPHQSVIHCGC